MPVWLADPDGPRSMTTLDAIEILAASPTFHKSRWILLQDRSEDQQQARPVLNSRSLGENPRRRKKKKVKSHPPSPAIATPVASTDTTSVNLDLDEIEEVQNKYLYPQTHDKARTGFGEAEESPRRFERS